MILAFQSPGLRKSEQTNKQTSLSIPALICYDTLGKLINEWQDRKKKWRILSLNSQYLLLSETQTGWAGRHAILKHWEIWMPELPWTLTGPKMIFGVAGIHFPSFCSCKTPPVLDFIVSFVTFPHIHSSFGWNSWLNCFLCIWGVSAFRKYNFFPFFLLLFLVQFAFAWYNLHGRGLCLLKCSRTWWTSQWHGCIPYSKCFKNNKNSLLFPGLEF